MMGWILLSLIILTIFTEGILSIFRCYTYVAYSGSDNYRKNVYNYYKKKIVD